MASVTTDITTFTGAGGVSTWDYAYAATDWTVVNFTPALDADYMVEGSGCYGAKLSKTTVMTADFIISAASIDLTNQNVYIWMLCLTPALLATKINGGMRVRLVDSSANWGEWYVDGSDTYPGGWQCYCCNTATAWNNKSATAPVISSIKKIGVGVLQTAGANKTNFFFDAFRHGTGLTMTLGDTTTPGTLEDFYTYDNTSKLGVIRKYKGVYLIQGGGGTTKALTIGSTGSAATYFLDATGAVSIFLQNPAYVTPGSILYDNQATPAPLISPNGIKVVGNGTANTEAHFISSVFKAENNNCRYLIDVSTTTITKFTFNGVSFQDADTITGQAYNADKLFTNCTFARCNRVEPSTGTIAGSTFSGAPGRALLIDSASHHITNCIFQNCGIALDLSTATTYAISGFSFSGNTIDVLNTSAGTVIVNASSCTGLTTKFTALASTNSKAQSYNNTGTVYTNESTPAYNGTVYDMSLLSDATEVGDAYFWGHTTTKFTSVLLRQEIAATFSGSPWVLTWEFSTGAGTWSTLSVTDNTTSFSAACPFTRHITFTDPGATWVTATYNSVTAYWIRARISTYNAATIKPKGSQSWLATTSTTTINNTVTVKVTVRDASTGNTIDGARVYLTADAGGDLTQGTIILNDLSSSGIVQDTGFNFTNNQPVIGRVRRGTSTPLFKTALLSGTIYNTGLNLVTFLVGDE